MGGPIIVVNDPWVLPLNFSHFCKLGKDFGLVSWGWVLGRWPAIWGKGWWPWADLEKLFSFLPTSIWGLKFSAIIVIFGYYREKSFCKLQKYSMAEHFLLKAFSTSRCLHKYWHICTSKTSQKIYSVKANPSWLYYYSSICSWTFLMITEL